MNRQEVLVSGLALGAICLAASSGVAFILDLLGAFDEASAPDPDTAIATFVSAIVISPALETCLIFLAIKGLARVLPRNLSWVIAGGGMALLHSLISPFWGVVVLGPFLLQARAMLDEDVPLKGRFMIVFLAHLANNSVAFLIMLRSME